MRNVTTVFIHCSATDNPEQQNLRAVEELHISNKSFPVKWGEYNTHGKGFTRVGYHILIKRDGEIELGRPIEMVGAGVYGRNEDSIHICLHGVKNFSEHQYQTLNEVVDDLIFRFKLDIEDILGHYEHDKSKTCPNIDMPTYRYAYKIRRDRHLEPINIDLPNTTDKIS